jgi:hypothetical protein
LKIPRSCEPDLRAGAGFRPGLREARCRAAAPFLAVVAAMVGDMKAGRAFRPGLRVKTVQGWPGVWEMTWEPDGRATFEYGPEQRPGEPQWSGAGSVGPDTTIFRRL